MPDVLEFDLIVSGVVANTAALFGKKVAVVERNAGDGVLPGFRVPVARLFE